MLPVYVRTVNISAMDNCDSGGSPWLSTVCFVGRKVGSWLVESLAAETQMQTATVRVSTVLGATVSTRLSPFPQPISSTFSILRSDSCVSLLEPRPARSIITKASLKERASLQLLHVEMSKVHRLDTLPGFAFLLRSLWAWSQQTTVPFGSVCNELNRL